MASTLRRAQPGWLAQSLQASKRYESKNLERVAEVRGNWRRDGDQGVESRPKSDKDS
jgi:hypothetical protein